MYLLAASFMQIIHSKQTFLPYIPTSDYTFKTSIHNLKGKNPYVINSFFIILQADVEGTDKTAQRKYTADEMKRRGITQFCYNENIKLSLHVATNNIFFSVKFS